MTPRNPHLAIGNCLAVGARGESAEECAVREIDEELGLEIDIDALEIIEQQDRGNHLLTFFKLELANLKGLKEVGDEREEIKVFKPEEILKMPDLFPNHIRIISRGLAV